MENQTSEKKEGSHLTGFLQGQDDFKVLLNGITDYGIFMMDPTGIILSWNSGAENIKGYTAEEIIGKHFSTFYTETDKAIGHPAKELNLAAQTGRYEEEGWRVRKDGSVFWANIIITRLLTKDNRILGFSKVTRDLTERRNAEAALRESEEKFRLMVESVKDYAILLLDPTGKVVSWNEGAERTKGWKPNEIIGRHFSIFYDAEDLSYGKPEFELRIATQDGRFEDTGWRIKKDGTKFWANVIITALKDEKGNVRGFTKVTRDMTEKLRADNELKRAYADLEKTVTDRTNALMVANRELQSFSYSVSHDLRAPLRSMDGFSQALLTQYRDVLDEKGQGYLKRIRESAQKMGQLIEDILNLSKIGRSEISKTEVDITEMVKEICNKFSTEDQDREIDCVIMDGMRAFADENMLRTVYENLIGNSFKYTAKTLNPRIEIGRSTKNNTDVFFVKDNGAGFDMSYIDKLFVPFQRLHSDKEFAGTGIGLASARRVISMHGGDIWASGEPQKGCSFFFTLQGEDSSK